MRSSRQSDETLGLHTPAPHSSSKAMHDAIPFSERLTCTINEACEATGLGRTKLYELIGAGHVDTTSIGRRRLVVVRSLRALLLADSA